MLTINNKVALQTPVPTSVFYVQFGSVYGGGWGPRGQPSLYTATVAFSAYLLQVQ